MTVYGGVLTTAGATNVNSLGELVLTMTMLNDFDTAVQGAGWSVTTSSLRSATGPLFINLQDVGGSTQVGVAPGTYTSYILFPCTMLFIQTGRLKSLTLYHQDQCLPKENATLLSLQLNRTSSELAVQSRFIASSNLATRF